MLRDMRLWVSDTSTFFAKNVVRGEAVPHVVPICDDLLTGFPSKKRPLRLLSRIQSS